jgi:hypothetical protein
MPIFIGMHALMEPAVKKKLKHKKCRHAKLIIIPILGISND